MDQPAITTAPKFLGCFTSKGQAQRRLVFEINEVNPSLSLVQLDRWLVAAFAAPPPWPNDSDQSLTLAVTARALELALELMRAAKIPVFDRARIQSAQLGSASSVNRLRIIAMVPSIDHLPEPIFSAVYQISIRLVFAATRELARGITPDIAQARHTVQNQIIRKLEAAVPCGISTVPMLREAWQRGIPFRHLGGGVFQLGWGSKSRRISRSSVDADSSIGAKIAGMKTHTAVVLAASGLPCPQHALAGNVAQAHAVAQQLGWPVVIKPADRERSEGVTTNVCDFQGVQTAFEHSSKYSKSILVEKQVPGICYRLMIANGRFLYALWRRPMSVIGNGVDDMATLITSIYEATARLPLWARDKAVPLDQLTHQVLQSQGLNEHSVPLEGQRVLVRYIESTEWGEDRGDATPQTHPENAALAERAARALGLVNAGVDVISNDISVPWHKNGAMINEVNYAPHFGGTAVARSRMPDFFDSLVEGDGRIPIEIFVGQASAWQAALVRQTEWRALGLRAWITSSVRTLDEKGGDISYGCEGTFSRALALMCDQQVDAIAIVLDDTRWLQSGAPFDRIEAWKDLRNDADKSIDSEKLFALLSALLVV